MCLCTLYSFVHCESLEAVTHSSSSEHSLGPNLTFLFFFNFIYLFTYFWLRGVFVAACRLSLVAERGGLVFIVVRRLLIAAASLVAGHGLSSCGTRAQLLWLMGSRAQAQ